MRTTTLKKCPVCKNDFTVTSQNRRKTHCSVKCANKAIQQSRKINIDFKLLLNTVKESKNYIEACEKLGITPWTLYRRMKELNIPKFKRQLKKRTDGYWGYTCHKNHRRIIEEHIGRKLTKQEHVHHIDGDKVNNRIDNLCIVESSSTHALIHHSLEECAFIFVKNGVINFDPVSKKYFIKGLF